MRAILYLLGNVLYFISYITPKSPVIWVFGSWGGKEFADNPKYLYNYIKNNHPEIKPIWLTRNQELFKKLKKEGHDIYINNSFIGLWYSCRAKVGVTSHGMIDLNRFACGRLKIVQTWHGIAIKPVLLSDPKKSAILKRKKLQMLSYFFFYLKKELNFNDNLVICSSSDYVTNIMKLCFGKNAPLTNIGFPRLDGLFAPNTKFSIVQKIKLSKEQGKKIGIYVPTYRRDGEYDVISLFLSNFYKIEESLKINNQILFLKIHPFEFHKIQNINSSEYVQFIINEDIEGDLYSILGLFDFLISDYSSVIFDYLLLARPTYLLVPDREEYISSNGKLVYDYVNIGLPIYEEWDQLLKDLAKPFSDLCLENIINISEKFYKYRDGDNSKRLFNYIIKSVN